FRKFPSRLTVNTILEKTGDLRQNRIALARIDRRRSFAISTIRSATGSRRLLKILAGRSRASNVERSVIFDYLRDRPSHLRYSPRQMTTKMRFRGFQRGGRFVWPRIRLIEASRSGSIVWIMSVGLSSTSTT